MHFVVLAGILRIAKESIFSGLNNIEVNMILNTEYSQYFGFTQEEVNQIAEAYMCVEKLDIPLRIRIRHEFDKLSAFEKSIHNTIDFRTFLNGFVIRRVWKTRRKLKGEIWNIRIRDRWQHERRLRQCWRVQPTYECLGIS